MRFLVHLLLLLAIALSLGFGLSYYALTDGRLFAARHIGSWATWPDIGSPEPDPYTRAYLARQGILQLGSSEGSQFVAEADENGHELLANCTYRIDGRTPLAAFWTLVAVNGKGENIAADGAQLFIDSTHIARTSDGSIVVKVGEHLASANWLEVESDTPYKLILTLYDTANFSGAGSRRLELPTILNEGCR